MRFEITLQLNKSESGNIIPINYQYELSSWIYKVLNEGDPVFSAWLHSKGYKSNEKPFRLFTFSRFFIDKFKVNGDRLAILSDKVKFIISFLPDEIITPFIIGLFKDRHLVIGDKVSRASFDVINIQNLEIIEFTDKMVFKTISPVYVYYCIEPGARNKMHLSPDSGIYSQMISGNLCEKYRALFKKEPDPDWTVTITPVNKPKAKIITIKTGTPQATQIKGYEYRFTVNGSPELIKIGYYGGFGGLNSQGFGCVERLETDNI